MNYNERYLKDQRQSYTKAVQTNPAMRQMAIMKEVWEGLLDSIPLIIRDLIVISRELPGLNELSIADFSTIVNNKVFDFYLLRNAPLLQHDESYYMLPNGVIYSRAWMNSIIGSEMTNAIFRFSQRLNKMQFTTKEMAILLPFILTLYIYGKLIITIWKV